MKNFKIELENVRDLVNKHTDFYCSLNANDIDSGKYSFIYNKRNLLFISSKNEKGLIYCPESKKHSNGTHWFNIGDERIEQMNQFGKSYLLFRLDETGLGLIRFSDIKNLFNEETKILADCKAYYDVTIKNKTMIIGGKDGYTYNITRFGKHPGSIKINHYERDIEVLTSSDFRNGLFFYGF